MKITAIESLHADGGGRAFDFLKVSTDDGLVGWSEYNEAFGGLGVTQVIEGLAPAVIGKDPRAVEAHVTLLQALRRTAPGGVNQQAVALATKLGVTPEESPTSTGLKQGGEQAAQRMQGLSGAAFDRAYIDNEVTYHQTVLDAIDQTLIPSAQNAELKALLEQTRPAVAAHLDHAKRIQSSLPQAGQ